MCGRLFRSQNKTFAFLAIAYLVVLQSFTKGQEVNRTSPTVTPSFRIWRLPQVENGPVIPSTVPSDSVSVLFQGPTSLDSLIRYAIACNPEIAAARYRARQLGARVPQVKSLPDPQLTTTAFLQAIQTAAGPQEAAMSLSQKFPWFGKLSLRSQVAYQDTMAAYAQASAVELKVIEQVKLAYYDLYFLQNAIAETRKLQQPLKNIIEVARSRYETSVDSSGMVSVLQTQVELGKLRTELVRLEASQIKAQARLAGVLNLPPQTRIDAMRNLHASGLTQQANTLVALAEQCQPELAARRREIARDRSAVRLACRDYYPDLTLGLNWYEIGNTGISPFHTGQDAYAMTAGVNLPIYRKRLNAAVRESQYKQSASQRRYIASRDRLQTEVLSLYAVLQEQDRTIQILRSEILSPASQALDLSIELYRTGKIDYEQLIDSFRTLLNFRIDYYRRFARREQAIASLERAVGCAVSSKLEEVQRPDAEPVHAPVPSVR